MNTLVAEGVVLEPVFTPIADMVLTMAEVEGTVSMHSDGEPRTAVCSSVDCTLGRGRI